MFVVMSNFTVLSDLSATFHTVNQEILLHRFTTHIGVTSNDLAWFCPYLVNTLSSAYLQEMFTAKYIRSSLKDPLRTTLPQCVGVIYILKSLSASKWTLYQYAYMNIRVTLIDVNL